MSPELNNARVRIAAALDRLSELFTPDMKITFIARHPTKDERHVIVSNDDLAGLRDLLAREMVKEEVSDPAGQSLTCP